MGSLRLVLLAGGTGATGRLAVRRLRGLRIPTRILTRDRRRLSGVAPVEVVQGDAMVEDDCRRAVDGCEGVSCAVGVHNTRWKGPCVDGDGIINLARAAGRAGVRRFVLVSSLDGPVRLCAVTAKRKQVGRFHLAG